MEFKIAVQFLFLELCFYLVYSLECQKCTDSTNSTCHMGTAETTLTCPTEDDSCYEEYILNNKSAPLYRRGCAPWSWCATQHKNHYNALKYCRTCQGDKCNNKAFRSSHSKECLKCSGSVNSTCQMGTAETTLTCPTGDDSCYEEYIQNIRSTPLYRRGCAPWSWCATQDKNHYDALKFCRTCRGDKCNNQAMELIIMQECLNCTGANNSVCETGKVETTQSCPPEQDECYEETILNIGHLPYYRRGCSPPGWCDIQKKNHAKALNHCRTCKEKKCNNQVIESPESKERRRKLRLSAAAAAASKG